MPREAAYLKSYLKNRMQGKAAGLPCIMRPSWSRSVDEVVDDPTAAEDDRDADQDR